MNEERADNGAGNLQEGREWVTDHLSEVDQKVRGFLTEHPFLSLAAAVGIGFLTARLVSSRGAKAAR